MIEPVLRRKVLRPRGRAEVPPEQGSALTRALPRTVVRAISAGAGLTARTGAVADRRVPLAEALDLIDVDGFLALLGRAGQPGPGALAILDQTLFSALVEALTVGRLGPAGAAAPRRPTATDAALLGAVIDRILADLDRALREAGAGDPDGAGPWQLVRGLTEPRLLGAILDDGAYQLIEIPVALLEGAGSGGRDGKIALLLPVAEVPAQVAAAAAGAPSVEAGEGMAPGIEGMIGAAPAVLKAVLGRVVLPLDQALVLAVGQRLELPLAALEEVELVGPDGQAHATARLGQSRGMRAVRIVALGGASPTPAPPTFAEAGPALPYAEVDHAGGD